MKRVLKTLRAVLSGTADANIRFDELCGLLETFEKYRFEEINDAAV